MGPIGSRRAWSAVFVFCAAGSPSAAQEVGGLPRLVVQLGHTDGPASALTYSPDGSLVATASTVPGLSDPTETLIIWDVATGLELRRWTAGALADLSFVDDTLLYVQHWAESDEVLSVTSGSRQSVRLLRDDDWDMAASLRPWGRARSTDLSRTLVWGQHVFPPEVRLMTQEHGTWRYTGTTTPLDVPPSARSAWNAQRSGVRLSPDGKYVVAPAADGDAAGGQYLLWSTLTGAVVASPGARTDGGRRLAVFDSGSRWLAAVVRDSSEASTVEVWQLDSRDGNPPLRSAGRVMIGCDRVADLAVSSAGALAAACDDGRVLFTDSDAGQVVREAVLDLPAPYASLAFSPDGATLAAGGTQGGAVLIDVADGAVFRSLGGQVAMPFAAAAAPAADQVLVGTSRGALLWDLTTGKPLGEFMDGPAYSVAFAGSAPRFAAGGDNEARVWDAETGAEVARVEHVEPGGAERRRPVTAVSLSADGKRLVTASRMGGLWPWYVPTGIELAYTRRNWSASGGDPLLSATMSADGERVFAGYPNGAAVTRFHDASEFFRVGEETQLDGVVVAASRDDSAFLTGGGDGTLALWSAADGSLIRWLQERTCEPGATLNGIYCDDAGFMAVALSADAATAAAGTRTGEILTWETADGGESYVGRHGARITALEFVSDRLLVSTSADGTIRLWDFRERKELGQFVSSMGGGWTFVAPDGRFDTDDLEQSRGLHWIMPDDPLTPLPIETFMRDYYEPRLLPRLLGGEPLPQIGDLMDRNRVQPGIDIIDVEHAADGTAAITIELTSVERVRGASRIVSGVHDVRVSRDGQLVAWQEGAVVSGTGTVRIRFEGIALPSRGDSVTFSAYAFNDDRVKSRTDYHSVRVPPNVSRPRRAYVVSLGVDRFDEPAWNLGFAANDARQFQRVLPSVLEGGGQFDEVVRIPLIAGHRGPGDHPGNARKETFQGVLALLAGEHVPDRVRAGIPNAGRIRPASPDDLVIITASTHGYSDERGVFYLLPEDVPAGDGRSITSALLRSAISSDDMTEWLRGVDAGDLVMIIDACHAAAAVEGTDFKPGPMGSRGLGQLAFDKSMRILTATQSADVALESGQLQHGLLSFALIENGLEARRADREPVDGVITLDEWLAYGVARVPELHREVQEGLIQVVRGADRGFGDTVSRERAASLQTPSLFDFTRRRDALILVPSP